MSADNFPSSSSFRRESQQQQRQSQSLSQWQKFYGFRSPSPHWYNHATKETLHVEPVEVARRMMKVYKRVNEELEDDDECEQGDIIILQPSERQLPIRFISSYPGQHQQQHQQQQQQQQQQGQRRSPYDAILHFEGVATQHGVGASYHIFDIESSAVPKPLFMGG
jgi:hypothetical protein